MKVSQIILIVFVAVIGIFGIWGCNSYNSLVNSDENVKKAWADVESSYQRRFDLIDNLVATVKGAADFEKSTLTEVVEARSKAFDVKIDANSLTPENIQKYQAAQGSLSNALGKLMVLTENYPSLRATENFTNLQTQLEGTENRIKTARDNFNSAVQEYNGKVRRFPSNIIAGLGGFEVKEGFKSDEGAEKAPKVKF